MSDIEEIKSRLNIVDIIGAKVTLKKAGRTFKGLCPFHNEKSPSFVVSPDRQIFHCFGCHKGGTIFDFVMEYNHVDFVEALEELAEKAGVKLTKKFGDSPQDKLKQEIYKVNALAADYFHYLLTKHALGENARQYLKQRGVSDKSIVTFQLGYSANSWDGLYGFLRKKGYTDTLLDQAGLAVKSQRGSFYDRFRGRVMFTLKDHRGQVVGFAGRVLDPTAKEAKYINTSETPVYSKSHVLYGLDVTKGNIQKEGEAILMEGELDMISSFQAGISNAVAIKGSALTEGHIHLLKRFTERLVFALDSDLAGDGAARRGIELADKAGMDMKVVVLPSGKDPDEAARENPVAFKKAIKDAVPIYDYFLSSITKRYDLATAFGKKKASDEFLPTLVKIENPIVQGHYVKKFSQLVDMSEETITSAMRKVARSSVLTNVKVMDKSDDAVKRSRTESLELYTLALLLQGNTKDLWEEFVHDVAVDAVTSPTVRRIVESLQTFMDNNPVFLLKDFADQLPPELAPTLDEAFLWEVAAADDEELFAREWAKTLVELRKTILRRTLTHISHEADALADDAAGEELKGRMKALTDELKALETSS